jgi:hypothetical protein
MDWFVIERFCSFYLQGKMTDNRLRPCIYSLNHGSLENSCVLIGGSGSMGNQWQPTFRYRKSFSWPLYLYWRMVWLSNETDHGIFKSLYLCRIIVSLIRLSFSMTSASPP